MVQTVPTGWEEKSVCDICNVYQPQTISSKDLIPDGKYTVFGANGIIGRYNSYNHEKSEVLVTCRGATCGSINKSLPFSWINGNAMVVSPKDENIISKDYLYHFLAATDFTYFITGAAQPQITRVGLSSLKISYPPLPEQERIVAKLDKAFEAIDKVKANAEQNLNNAKKLFNDTLDSKIRTLYKNSSTQKLSEVCDVRDGTHDSPKYLDKRGHPFVTSKNLKNDKIDMEKITYISDSDFEKINERSKVDIGDVLFAMIGTIGNPVVITEEPDFAIKNVALFKNINKLEPQYLKFLLKSPSVLLKMQLEASGTTQKFVSLKYLRNFMVPVPSLSEQQKIVEKLDVLQEQTKQLEAIYTQKIKECDELKQSILQKAFRGEL